MSWYYNLRTALKQGGPVGGVSSYDAATGKPVASLLAAGMGNKEFAESIMRDVGISKYKIVMERKGKSLGKTFEDRVNAHFAAITTAIGLLQPSYKAMYDAYIDQGETPGVALAAAFKSIKGSVLGIVDRVEKTHPLEFVDSVYKSGNVMIKN